VVLLIVLVVLPMSIGMACGSSSSTPAAPTQEPTQQPATGTPTPGEISGGVTPSNPGTPSPQPTPCPTPTPTPTPDLDKLIIFDDATWTAPQQAIAMEAIHTISAKLPGGSISAFLQAYNVSESAPLRFIKKSDAGTGCAAGPHLIKCNPNYNLTDPRIIVHELGHVLHQNNPTRNLYGDLRNPENAIVDDSGRWVTGVHPRGDECLNNNNPNSNLGIRCAATNIDQYGSFERTFIGYTGDINPYVYHGREFSDWNSVNEDFADMFMNWVYNTFDYSEDANNAGTKRYQWMDERVSNLNR
jgi:hypothetical protein